RANGRHVRTAAYRAMQTNGTRPQPCLADARTNDPPRMMPPFVEAMRPHQWVKNLLVLAPLAFTPKGLIYEPWAWAAVLAAYESFCLAASSIYLLNDIVDRQEDALHPKKRARPIASGRLSVRAAKVQLAVQ